jgi:hypothetical protein
LRDPSRVGRRVLLAAPSDLSAAAPDHAAREKLSLAVPVRRSTNAEVSPMGIRPSGSGPNVRRALGPVAAPESGVQRSATESALEGQVAGAGPRDLLGQFAGVEMVDLRELRLTTLPDSAFENAMAMSSCVLPHEMATLGSRCFAGCGRLQSLDLPDGVRRVGNEAFAGCGG